MFHIAGKNMNGFVKWSCAAALLAASLLGVSTRCAAQIANAQINGTVHDSTGAVIPNARIVLENVETGIRTPTVTDADGIYIIQQILPGMYTLEASRDGFETTRLKPFRLVVNQASVIDISLSVGSSSESVTVQAQGAEVESSTAELGTVLTATQVQDLPTGRNTQELMILTPGVSEIQTGQSPIPSVNGQINRTSIFLLDGVSDTAEVYSSQALSPIPETVDQFKVESHNDSAVLGGVLGGIINQATKSGTNDFHGQVWEIEQDNVFNAVNYFTPPGSVSTGLHDHVMGAVLGGPVWLPKLYKGRNRTFFFVGYQYHTNSSHASNIYRVPTPANLQGDFSNLLQSGIQLYNPFTTRPDPANPGQYIRDPFQNNQIPLSLLYAGYTQVFAKALIPQPVVIPGQSAYNAINGQPTVEHDQSLNVRIDQKFSDRDTIFGRYTGYYSPSTAGTYYLPTLNSETYTRTDTSAFGWVHTFSGTAVLQALFGSTVYYANNTQLFTNVSSAASFNSQVGFSSNYTAPFVNGATYVPGVDVPGYFDTGEEFSHNQPADDLHWRASYSKLLKNHLIQFGGEYNKLGYSYTTGQDVTSFSQTQTSNLEAPAGTGDALASFLINVPDSVTRNDAIESIPWKTGEEGFYFQDSWKALDNLVVNLGLRYDRPFYPSAGTKADNNNQIGDMDYYNGTYILQASAPPCSQTGAPPCINTPGGVLPAHVVVSPTGKILKDDTKNFQPRLGIAYRLGAKTAIRAAAGLFFDDLSGSTQLARNPSGTWPSLGIEQFANLNYPSSTQPLPTTTGTDPIPSTQLPGASPFTQGDDYFFDPNWKNPYSEQWNLGVERQLAPDLLTTINYVGSTSHRTDVGGRYNVAPTPGPGDPSLRYPFPYMPIPFSFDRSIGTSNYNALELSLEKRFTNGLAFTVAYSYSKSLDFGSSGMFSIEGFSVENPYNIRPDYGPSSYNIPNNLTVSWVYQLPFGTGKEFSSGNKIVDVVLGNWQWNGIADIRSGEPINLTVNGDIANTGNFGYERPDVVGNYHNFHGTKAEWFNTKAFAAPQPFTFGDAGRDLLRTQFVHIFNMGLFKQIPIHEGIYGELRAEAYNVFNTPILDAPDSELTDSTFGVVTSAQSPRTMQIGARIHF
jgi:Carboxypeptidase regulatory-like domain/TonB dependent receptor